MISTGDLFSSAISPETECEAMLHVGATLITVIRIRYMDVVWGWVKPIENPLFIHQQL